MGWEDVSIRTWPCKCGKGTMTKIVQMDDWNRTRVKSFTIDCPECLEKYEKEQKEIALREERKRNLHNKAQEMAISRYMDVWLSKFEGLNKKQACEYIKSLTKSSYPSYNTFCKHTKESGMTKHLEYVLKFNFERIVTKIGVEDEELFALINELNRIY